MKLSEFINKIFNKNLKKLSSGNIVETKIIPIIFKNKDDEIIANYIADDINKNIELYKIFLKEYNAINIGDIDNKNDKTIKLKHCFDKILFKNEKKFKGSLRTDSILLIEDELRKMYQNRFECLDIAWLKENIKGNSSFIPIGGTIEHELYWNITKYIENDKLYLNCLSSLKDMDGLELLLKSKHTKEFLTKYNEKNAFKLLNWAVEVSTDHTYDNFFLKNLDIIDEAIQHTKYDAKDDINAVLNGEEMHIDYPNEKNSKLYNENNMTKTEQVLLTKKILDSFDTSGKLGEAFEEKMKKGRIFLIYPEEEKQAADTLGYLWGVSENKDDLVNKPYYEPAYDMCIIPLKCNISDVPIIIHEFVHQYYYNNTKNDNPYSLEIPSIFFEKESIKYLKENGYNVEEVFEHRKEHDSVNNYLFLKEYVRMCKIKKNGEITFENVLNEDLENILKTQLQNNPNVTNEEIVNAKNKIAQLNLRELKTLEENVGMNNVKLMVSYTIGTFIADKYNESDLVKKEMLELINNPKHSIQSILDEIAEDKKEDILNRKDNNIEKKEI